MNHRGKRWITELEGVSQEALHKAASKDRPCKSETIGTYPVCRKALLQGIANSTHKEERTSERKDYSNCREVLTRRTGHFCHTWCWWRLVPTSLASVSLLQETLFTEAIVTRWNVQWRNGSKANIQQQRKLNQFTQRNTKLEQVSILVILEQDSINKIPGRTLGTGEMAQHLALAALWVDMD